MELEDVMGSRSWRWFLVKITGLLACDSRLSRHFAAAERAVTPTTPGGR